MHGRPCSHPQECPSGGVSDVEVLPLREDEAGAQNLSGQDTAAMAASVGALSAV